MAIRKRTLSREVASAMGKKGGPAAKAARARGGAPPPYPGDFLAFLADVEMSAPSWNAWRVLWAAVDALPLSEDDRRTFEAQTGRTAPPRQPVREAWLVCGRRSGKSRSMAARAAWTAVRRDWRAELAKGEVATIPLIAGDRQQAATVMGYVRAMFEHAALRPFVRAQTRDSLTLATGAVLRVATCSYRSVRGLTCPLVVADESAFWRTSDGSANPDSEVIGALRPTLMTIKDGLLLVGSTPYARAGALFKASEAHYGQDSDRVLVWNASSDVMNPDVDRGEIAEAFESDAVAAASEYGQDGHVQFRSDVSALFDVDALRAVVERGCHERPPVPDVRYVGAVDVAGGSGTDSYTCAVAHLDDGAAVLDAVREVRPRFSPDAVTAELAALMKSYGIAAVVGDHFGGEWPREAWRAHGIEYQTAAKTRSAYYGEMLPAVNAGRVRLLDHARLLAQLGGLERRVTAAGRDQIDHGPSAHAHDDVSNAAAIALGEVLSGAGGAVSLGDAVAGLIAVNASLAVTSWRPEGRRWAGGGTALPEAMAKFAEDHPEQFYAP